MNGKEAIDKVMKKLEDKCCNGYQMIVMDINMPVMDGIEASKILSDMVRKKKIPQTVIVAASADSMKDDEKLVFYKETGFVDYLPKPTAKDKFIEMLRKYRVIRSVI